MSKSAGSWTTNSTSALSLPMTRARTSSISRRNLVATSFRTMELGAARTNLSPDTSTAASGAKHAFQVGSGTCLRRMAEHAAHTSSRSLIFQSRRQPHFAHNPVDLGGDRADPGLPGGRGAPGRGKEPVSNWGYTFWLPA